mmetsp:Transcript_2829/g.3187  ORF Transcript_2829/g.3187 Transcript_2829/m.3187 type:complete len:529 (-) Transcript_2829:611-2197(-)|eukprot:CAMPEP_0197848000 /NCGR_PEP_ID=MMETSP1438-20131217/7722_1 /TAXON_ID=1461541 /ORGANISM="Pterosperma sp., Strain CCMP1384" /LENGTH=528 /DNA_ID=CAMNT_0043460101 /DNA_START=114 /DNA_END=1700 /DNA_ORIENTATION=+
MAAQQPYDFLNFDKNTSIWKLLSSYSASNEVIYFSDQVLKVNRKGVAQKRKLMITNRALYNLEQSTFQGLQCKRRIELANIEKVICSSVSDHVILCVPKEYDYHYQTPPNRKKIIVDLVTSLKHQTYGSEPEVVVVNAPDLRNYVYTKTDAKVIGKPDGADGAEEAMAKMSVNSTEKGRSDTVMHFSCQEKEKVDLDSFELLKVIGKGSFGKVMQVRKKDDGIIYAMKVLHKDAVIARNQLEHTKAERHILQAVQHPFLVCLKYAFQSESKLYMVLDYLNGGELFFHLKNAKRFSEPRAQLYAAEITLALGHLHSLNIVYRDLKPENILLDKDGHIRITDFGLAKEQVNDNSSAQTFCGTPEYLAPEILSSQGHGRAVDWWSLGTLVFEMLTGLPPFYDHNLNVMYKKILQAQLVFPPQLIGPDAKDMLEKLLDRNPETRLGSAECDADEIKRHPFFKGMDWKLLEAKKIEAPFKPDVKADDSVANFDTCFTDELAQDTFVDTSALSKEATSNFDGFTFQPTSALGGR